MGLIDGILNSVTKSVTKSISETVGEKVKEGVNTKIREGIDSLNNEDDTINKQINLFKLAINEGREKEFLESIDINVKRLMLAKLVKKQTAYIFDQGQESTNRLNEEVKCIDILTQDINRIDKK